MWTALFSCVGEQGADARSQDRGPLPPAPVFACYVTLLVDALGIPAMAEAKTSCPAILREPGVTRALSFRFLPWQRGGEWSGDRGESATRGAPARADFRILLGRDELLARGLTSADLAPLSPISASGR